MTIILKEAFRHQNFLSSLLDKAQYYLANTNNVMVSTERHIRSAVQPNAKDEEKDNLADRGIPVSPNTVIAFVCAVFDEKVKLSKAINNAKTQHCNELDMDIALNRTRQRIVDIMKRLAALRNKESIVKGSDYCFNNEGNQIMYYYDVEKTTKVDFDMKNVKRTIAALSNDSNSTSNTVDYWLSSVPVDYTPVFDINSSFEELVEEFGTVDMAS